MLYKSCWIKLHHYSVVRSIRGVGLLIGIECVEPVAPIIKELHRYGVLVLPGGSHVIRSMPNLYVTKEEIDRVVDIISAMKKGDLADRAYRANLIKHIEYFM